MLRRLAAELRARILGQIQKESKDALLLQGRIASWLVRSKETITSLRDVEFKVLSQFGEDGIIDWIIERSQIPDRLHSFIEFGVELYEEANTRFLLENRNWRGLIIDANSQLETKVRNSPLAWRHTLQAKSAFITRENINQVFAHSERKERWLRCGLCSALYCAQGRICLSTDPRRYCTVSVV